MHDAVLPVAVAILVVLFLVQRFGTHRVGRLLGPVMLLWFVTLAVLGIPGIARDPGVLRSLSPTYAVTFAVDRPFVAETVPLALRANAEFNGVVHEHVVIVSVVAENVPHVPRNERLNVDSLDYSDDGIVHLAVGFGFQDDQDIPGALRDAFLLTSELEVDPDTAFYFLSRITIERAGPWSWAHGSSCNGRRGRRHHSVTSGTVGARPEPFCLRLA